MTSLEQFRRLREVIIKHIPVPVPYDNALAALETERRERAERDKRVRAVLTAMRAGQYMTMANGVDKALALLDGETRA